MTEQQRQYMMITVLVVLAPFAAWHVLVPVLDSASSGGVELRALDRGGADGTHRQMVELRSSRLDRSVAEHRLERNIFQFQMPARSVNRQGAVLPGPDGDPPSAGVRNPEIPVRELQRPSVDVVLLGIFGPERRRIAAFADEGKVLNVLEKQVIDNKFIVHRIGLQSVDLTFIGFPDTPPVRMTIGGALAGTPSPGHSQPGPSQANAPVRGVS